jgi:hypothetical protein
MFKLFKKDKDREAISIKGKLKLIGRDKNGKVVFIKEVPNLITNAGFDFIANVIGATSQPNEITHMAIGNGTAGDATATTLTSETARSAATYAHTAGTKTFTFTATFTSVVAATEYGCFNNSSGGTMLNTAGFAAITIDSLQIVATFTLS